MLQNVGDILQTGQTFIGKFQVEKFLGRGGMGVVYLATDLVLNRPVALKIPLPEFARDPKARQNFMDEARKTARLEHPNIVQVYEAGEDSSSRLPYLVMQYLSGGTLRARIGKEGMKVEEAVDLFVQVCQGVYYAHQRHILHRDLSPDNLMFDQAGVVKITDFGLAKLVENTNYSRSGQFVGKPAYMSPEQWGAGKVDHTTDIYALGIIFYEALTGSVPFKANNPAEFVYKHMHASPPPLRSRTTRQVPDQVEEVICKCLAKNKTSRYQSAHEICQVLLGCIGDVSSTLPIPPTPVEVSNYQCSNCKARFQVPAPGNRCPNCGGKNIEETSITPIPTPTPGFHCSVCGHKSERLASGGRCPKCGSKVVQTALSPASPVSDFECPRCKHRFTQPASGGRCPRCGTKILSQ